MQDISAGFYFDRADHFAQSSRRQRSIVYFVVAFKAGQRCSPHEMRLVYVECTSIAVSFVEHYPIVVVVTVVFAVVVVVVIIVVAVAHEAFAAVEATEAAVVVIIIIVVIGGGGHFERIFFRLVHAMKRLG